MHRPGTWCRLKIHYCLHLLPAQTKCRLLVGWFFWGIVVQERNDEIVVVKYASLLQCFDTVGNRVSSADLCVLFFYGLLFFFFCEELSCCIQPNCAFVIYKSFVRKRKMGKTVKTKKPTTTVLPIWVSSIVYFPILSTESPTLLYRVVSGVCTQWENVFSSYIFVLINWRLFQFKLCFKQKLFKPTVDTVLGKQRQWVT